MSNQTLPEFLTECFSILGDLPSDAFSAELLESPTPLTLVDVGFLPEQRWVEVEGSLSGPESWRITFWGACCRAPTGR